MSKKIISILLVLLLVWDIILTVSFFKHQDGNNDTSVEEYRVSGFSTDLTMVADEIKSAVVSVRNGELLSTGFIYKKEDTKVYVLTSYHGDINSNAFDVVFDSGFRCSGRLFGYDSLLDLAILEMDVDEYIEYCSKYEDYEPFECHNDGECGGCPDFCDCPIIFNDDDDDDDCYDFDDDDDF